MAGSDPKLIPINGLRAALDEDVCSTISGQYLGLARIGKPETYYWLETPSEVGWVGVDALGHISEAAEVFQGLLGQRVAHLPADYLVLRLAAQPVIPRQPL